MLISEFDPWKSKLCTCPPRLIFNPYIACDHACVYCYASSYIPKSNNCRAKKDILRRLEKEASIHARLNKAFPRIAKELSPLYLEKGEEISGYLYLPREMRQKIMNEVKELTEKSGTKFGCCREDSAI